MKSACFFSIRLHSVKLQKAVNFIVTATEMSSIELPMDVADGGCCPVPTNREEGSSSPDRKLLVLLRSRSAPSLILSSTSTASADSTEWGSAEDSWTLLAREDPYSVLFKVEELDEEDDTNWFAFVASTFEVLPDVKILLPPQDELVSSLQLICRLSWLLAEPDVTHFWKNSTHHTY